ncbi:MAG: HEAT repeat domain-containing protein, partial [Myxococcales bacterium]
MQPVGHLEKVRALAVSSRTLAVAGVRVGTTSHLTLYNHLAEKPERSLDLPAHVLALAASDDRVIAACADGHLRVFGTKKGDLLLDIAAHQGAATSVATRGEVVASVGTDGALRVFSLDDGTRHHEWPLSSGPLRAVAIDAEAFAAAGDDGVVRVVWPNGAPTRVMPGHEGAVSCLAFTPSDGRLVSGGEDGTVRLWYLVGDIEADIRGKDESGHAGGVTGLLFPPEKDVSQLGARIVSVGLDGKLRVWRTAERRKPRTIEVGSEGLYAVAFARSTKPDTLGTLFASGDARTVTGIPLDAEGAPSDRIVRYAHGFSVLSEALGAQARPKREAAVKTLVTLGETEALELALRALSSDKDPEVRALTASELATHGRREARKGLRERLDDGHATVRSAALAALRKLEPDTPLSPLRAALASRHPDVRIAALQLLAPLFATSPVAAGMIAAHLTDGNAGVRQMALAQLVAIAPPGSSEPLRTAFERGTADVRAEVLVRGAMTGLTLAGDFAPLVGKALDDEDAEVRRVAFVVTAVAHPSLGAWLQSKDEEFGRALSDVTRRVATLQGVTGATGEPTADSLEAARVRLLGALAGRALTEEDREPLLASLACRTADTTLRGARGLALLGDMRALGALLTISRDASAGLRRDAALALVALDDPRARRRLAWMMSDADASVRDAALGCFTRLEPDALSVAEAALHASAEDMRVRGLDVLVKQGKGVARAEELLAASLEDEAPKVRSEAFRTLWAWHDAEPLGPLDRALTARFPDLRGRAVEELAALSSKPGGPLAAPSLTRLAQTVADRDATVALAAYEATLKGKGDADSDTHLAAMASTHPSMRTRGAKDAAKAPVDKVRSALSKLLDDTEEPVRIAAIEALDKLLPTEAGPLRIGLQSSHLDLRVRAAELLAVRRDEQLIDPMCALLADKELLKRLPLAIIVPLRQRASTSLASLGSPRLLKYFATDLIKDDDGVVREQASRGVSNASRRGEEGYLLDLLGHTELAIRSWAAEGLARLGDVRALPVLTGTLRHEHAPIRVGAVLSFAALGPEGFGGMLQGLEDPSREVQRIVLSIVLARDLRAFRHGEPPDLLASALSSQRPEVRFAAARAIELRIDPELYMGHLVEMLMPDKPEKASELAKWP